jgi:hypothetical protein
MTRALCHGRLLADNRGMPSPPEVAETAPLSRPAPRVVLADDDVLLREGLSSLLERSGFEVVGQAGNSPNCSPWPVRSSLSWRSSIFGCPPARPPRACRQRG